MSARVVKGFSIFFFLSLIIAIVATLYVIRTMQGESSSASFRKLIPVSEQFVKTFSTADIGTRDRLSRLLLQELDTSQASQARIENYRRETQLAWGRQGSIPLRPEANGLFETYMTTSIAGVATLTV